MNDKTNTTIIKACLTYCHNPVRKWEIPEALFSFFLTKAPFSKDESSPDILQAVSLAKNDRKGKKSLKLWSLPPHPYLLCALMCATLLEVLYVYNLIKFSKSTL